MTLMDAINKIDYEISKRDSPCYLKPILKVDFYNSYPDVLVFLELKSPFNKGLYSCVLFRELQNDKKESESFYSYIKNKMDKIEKEFEKLNNQ